MYPADAYAAALELSTIGMDASWIARELSVPRATVARWVRGDRRGRRSEPPRVLESQPYAYLLGLYLGDGHISRGAHGQHLLSIACDAAYPGIVAGAAAAVEALAPDRRVVIREHPRDRCTRVVCGSRFWPVLFPQHGPGRKHTRRIALAGWQRSLTSAHAHDLVRGLIHSDGCRYVACQRVGARTYRYARYCFSNRSPDLLAIFCDHLDLLEIGWTRPNDWTIAIDRRAEVAKLDVFVGPKR